MGFRFPHGNVLCAVSWLFVYCFIVYVDGGSDWQSGVSCESWRPMKKLRLLAYKIKLGKWVGIKTRPARCSSLDTYD